MKDAGYGSAGRAENACRGLGRLQRNPLGGETLGMRRSGKIALRASWRLGNRGMSRNRPETGKSGGEAPGSGWRPSPHRGNVSLLRARILPGSAAWGGR